MIKKRILILGGGIGGQVAANRLRSLLDRHHEITIIDKDESFAFAPSFLWLMIGDRRPEQISRKISQMVKPGIGVFQAEVRRIDLSSHFVEVDTGGHARGYLPSEQSEHEGEAHSRGEVTSPLLVEGATQAPVIETRRLDYDYLIIALGAELAPEIIPGLSETARIFYTIEGAKRLQDALKEFKGGTLAIVVSTLPYKCPGAPHEATMLFDDFFRKGGLRDKVDIHLFTPEPQPLPVAGPKLGGEVKQMIEAKGIHFHPLHKLLSVNPQARELIFEGKEKVGYDLLVAIPPHRGPNIIREAGLANEAGWLPVDPLTLKTRNEGVYAIGDIAAIPIPGRWRPDAPLMLPKAGVFAHAQAEVAAHNIAAEITGNAAKAKFQGMGYCMLETGRGRAGLAFGNFFAEPSPEIRLKGTGKTWHLGKVLLEQWWLAPFGPRREALRFSLELGARVFGIPVEL